MYSNNYESCVYVCGLFVSQAWEDSGGGGDGIKKKANRKIAKSKGCIPLFLMKHPMQAFLRVQNQRTSPVINLSERLLSSLK